MVGKGTATITAQILLANGMVTATATVTVDGGFNQLVFSDDFDTVNVDEDFTGNYGYKWYLTDLTGVSGDKSDYHLTDDGIMLEAKNMNHNWLLTSMDAETGAGWLGFTHGYLEFRTRFQHNVEPGTKEGTKAPDIWSFPPETIAPEAVGEFKTHVEMDWMEYWGDRNGDMH